MRPAGRERSSAALVFLLRTPPMPLPASRRDAAAGRVQQRYRHARATVERKPGRDHAAAATERAPGRLSSLEPERRHRGGCRPRRRADADPERCPVVVHARIALIEGDLGRRLAAGRPRLRNHRRSFAGKQEPDRAGQALGLRLAGAVVCRASLDRRRPRERERQPDAGRDRAAAVRHDSAVRHSAAGSHDLGRCSQ